MYKLSKRHGKQGDLFSCCSIFYKNNGTKVNKAPRVLVLLCYKKRQNIDKKFQ